MRATKLSLILFATLVVPTEVMMAQTAAHATIPFTFEADGTRMPAGKYEVLAAGSPKSVVLRAEGTEASATLDRTVVDRYSTGCSCLRFHRYADGSLVLSDINLGPKAPSLELLSAARKSREEFPVAAIQISLHTN